MRPPTRTDGPVQSFRKHPPPSQPLVPPATSISPPLQAPMSLAKGPLSSVTTAAAATRNDRGRRAFFNVESEQLLCCAAPAATAVAHVPPADKAVAVPYDRRIDCDDVPDDFSTQVSFCSGPTPVTKTAPVNATTASDDVPSLSANNRVVCADDEPPLWQARRAPNERRTNSSASARSDGQPQRDLSDRVALVKNSASLIFTKKTAPAPLKQQQQQPAVHRRQRDAGRVTTENRRSLHEHQQQTGVAAATAARHERAYSWYAPLYTPLREEGGRGGEYRLLQSTASPHREPPTSSPHVAHRLAASEAHSPSESESLLEPQPPRATVGRASGAIPPNTLHLKFQNTPATASSNTVRPPQADHILKQQQQQQRHFSMSPHGAEVQMAPVAAVAAPVTVVTPTPKYTRFEQLIKSLVGRKVSKGDTNSGGGGATAAPAAPATTNTASIGSSDATGATDTPMAPSRASLVTPTPMALNYALSTPINHAAGHYPLLPSPEIRITKSPSEYSLLGGGGGASTDRAHMSSTASLNAAVQQRLWSVVPLLTRRETAGGSCASLSQSSANIGAIGGRAALMKKCETVLALSRSSSSRHILEPAMAAASATATAIVRPQNRLRHSSSSTITCSRCSSLLSLAANGSRYSLNVSQGGGFVSIGGGADACDGSSVLSTPTPTAAAGCSRDSLLAAAGPMATTTTTAAATAAMASCKLCLGDVPANKLTVIAHCGCVFCTECMMAYVEFEILEGAYEISCPDALCPVQGALSIAEIARLSSSSLLDKHKRYRLNREVDLDKSRTWCPKAGCDTVCRVTSGTDRGGTPAGHDAGAVVSLQPISSSSLISSALNSGGGPCLVHCPTCTEQFCSGCKKTWHPSMSCEENTRRLAADGHADNIGIPFDNDLIKCCPTCSVPIEKDEGCAQMMCKRCKHVFCWYCLASLDDDFLLRHYDRGPCKNKLGHSRASVVWHRAQVIGIFAGFGILLLVASPLLLLAAPCIVCCKCRICSGAAKLEESGAEAEFEEFSALNR